jgi:hypothetical protein
VCVSLADNIYLLTVGGDGSGLSVTRLLRILQVVRLFKRLSSLQKILVCIMSAIRDVLLILILVLRAAACFQPTQFLADLYQERQLFLL